MVDGEKLQRLNLRQVSIKPASSADLESIFAILEQATAWLAARGMNHWNGVHSKESILADFETSHIFIAQTKEDRAIGTVTISFTPPIYHKSIDCDFWSVPDAPAAYVRKMAVLPKFMNLGIAAKLIKFAEDHARLTGSKFTRLDTNPAFPRLIPYYLKHGYIKKGERDGHSFFEKTLL